MKKTIKKYLSALLSLCFACSLLACQKDESTSQAENSKEFSESVSSVLDFSSEAISSKEDSSDQSSEEFSSEESSSEEESFLESNSEEESSSKDEEDGFIASAKSLVDKVLTRPDAWAFLPEAFQEENMAYTASAFPVTDFSQNTQVSAMGDRFIGSQLMVVYDGLLTMQSALNKVDVVFALGESLAMAYQSFINENPNEYALFSTSLAGFNIQIELDGAKSTLLIGNSLLNVELHADSDANTNSGRIQLTDGIALKYETTADSLIYAYQVGAGEAMRTVNMTFARSDDVVAGYIYEFMGYKGMGLTTTAVFTCDEEYTKVVAKKRESTDLIVLGNEEVYDSQTGEYVSGVVSETTKVMDFETYWFKLSDVSGFNSVKVVQGQDGDQVYVNGSNTVFATKNMSLINFSRRFDVETKTVYYVKEVQNGEDTAYELVKTEIPMLFAQTQTFGDLGSDIKAANSNDFTTTPTVTSGIAEVALEDFETLKGLFDNIQTLTYEAIVAYIGEKNEAFGA